MVEWLMAIGVALGLQATPAPMPPATKWVVDHSESSCRATRRFGSGDSSATLIVSLVPTSSSVSLALVVPRVAGQREPKERGSATVTLSPGQPLTSSYHLVLAEEGMQQFFLWIPRSATTQLAASTEIAIDVGRKHSLALTSMASLVHALGECEADFLTAWGVDTGTGAPSVFATPKRDMVPRAFGPDSYPLAAVAAKAEGIVVALLSVDAKGNVVGCGVASSSGNAALDRATCGAFVGPGAIFDPAEDAQGVAIASKLVIPVTWTSSAHADRAEAAAPGSIIVTGRL